MNSSELGVASIFLACFFTIVFTLYSYFENQGIRQAEVDKARIAYQLERVRMVDKKLDMINAGVIDSL